MTIKKYKELKTQLPRSIKRYCSQGKLPVRTRGLCSSQITMLALMTGILITNSAYADDSYLKKSNSKRPTPEHTSRGRIDAPTPLGMYGVNQPKQGEVNINLLPGYFALAGSQIGTQSVSPIYAVSNVYTTYSPKGVGVPTLVRNVPTNVNIWTVGISLTYGITKDFALTVASAYLDKNQRVNVYKGTTPGTTLLGSSDAGTSGIGDTSIVGLYHLYNNKVNQINVFFGVFLPTGSTTETEGGFNNSDVYDVKRAVYTLQLGTGTVDAIPGIVYSGLIGKWSWGFAYRGRLPLNNNAQGYRWGNYNEFDGWGDYTWLPGLSTSIRLQGTIVGHIEGYDPQVLGYGPCSNPLWFGGKYVDLFPGLSISGRYFNIPFATASVAVDIPLYQNLNGLHSSRNYSVLTGLKLKF